MEKNMETIVVYGDYFGMFYRILQRSCDALISR